MIDITKKKMIPREATASGKIFLKKETVQKIKNRQVEKGDALETARIAGINAVKQTQLLIPHCHQIPVAFADFKFNFGDDFIKAICTVRTEAKTGVEMEALVGVSICLNTIWDMVKYLEKDQAGQYPTTRITDIKVIKKLNSKGLSCVLGKQRINVNRRA